MKELTPDLPVFAIKGSDDECELIYEGGVLTDRAGRLYERVANSLADEDFYQGLNMVTVIKRIEDGKLFGYFWWDDISKHGKAYIESNGDEYGLEFEGDTDGPDFDWDSDYESYYVFTPVEAYPITAYREV